jgi:hypothetical protein
MGIGPWGAAVATLALVLVAAKAHGRQIRLEREAHGHMHVDFRRDNHPWVEALWRRDRRGFWGLYAALAAAVLLLFFPRSPSTTSAAGWGWLALALAGAFAACFTAMGLWSLVRLARDGAGASAWRRRAIRASFGWWSAVAALAGITAALAERA